MRVYPVNRIPRTFVTSGFRFGQGDIAIESFEGCIDVFGASSFSITVPPLPHTGRGKRAYRLAGLCLPDGVTGPETNPLGDGTVLLLSFGKLLLGTETLLALYKIYLR